MFENLTERLERSFKILKGQGRITEINVAETLKDVRRALLDADVNFRLARQFTDTVKQKALGQKVLTAVNPSQMMIKIVHDELVELMGADKTDINLKGNPAVILISGLQGSGKTTFSGKLALWLKTRHNRKPMLVACDIYRPLLSNSSTYWESRRKFLYLRETKAKTLSQSPSIQLKKQKERASIPLLLTRPDDLRLMNR